uniref:NPH3 domain-containing protein n=1 Tax=Nelumbo nucifera TaxID=4432 RepID=A0A822Y0V1_NELNU|nr:TPA_asm: hypothetical protein HUJ06_027370 [Nelumbo nucifera]
MNFDGIKDSECYRLCKTIDCQKLSQEAYSHVAQNERLPVQMAVQMLYFEQIRLRNAMNGGHNHFFFGSVNGQFPQCSSSGADNRTISARDNYASVRRENKGAEARSSSNENEADRPGERSCLHETEPGS